MFQGENSPPTDFKAMLPDLRGPVTPHMALCPNIPETVQNIRSWMFLSPQQLAEKITYALPPDTELTIFADKNKKVLEINMASRLGGREVLSVDKLKLFCDMSDRYITLGSLNTLEHQREDVRENVSAIFTDNMMRLAYYHGFRSVALQTRENGDAVYWTRMGFTLDSENAAGLKRCAEKIAKAWSSIAPSIHDEFTHLKTDEIIKSFERCAGAGSKYDNQANRMLMYISHPYNNITVGEHLLRLCGGFPAKLPLYSGTELGYLAMMGKKAEAAHRILLPLYKS